MYKVVERIHYGGNPVGGMRKNKIYETEALFRQYGLYHPLGRRPWAGKTYVERKAYKLVGMDPARWEEIHNV
jgi:hypothetical protein